MNIENVDFNKLSKNVTDDSKYIYKTFRNKEKYLNDEIETMQYIEEDLIKKNKSIKIDKQTFWATKKSHLWINTTAILFILSIAAYFYSPILSPIFIVIALFPFVFNYLFSMNTFNFLFAKQKSQNFTATLKPQKEVKKRIILTTHVDTTKVKLFNTVSIKIRFFIASFLILFCIYTFILSIISIAYTKVFFRPLYFDTEIEKLFSLIGISLLFFLPFIIYMFFMTGLKNSPSINTSLTSAFLAKEIVNNLKSKEMRPENTEIQLLIAGSSEDNLQGIKYLFKHNKNIYTDVPTISICLEALFEKSNIAANKTELRLIPKNSSNIIEMFSKSVDKLNININNDTYLFRNTETKIFNKNQIFSASITAEPLKSKLYASKDDKPSKIDSHCITRVSKIIFDMINEFDSIE